MKQPSYLKMVADDIDEIEFHARENIPNKLPLTAHKVLQLAKHARECLDMAAAIIDDTRLKVSAGLENDVEAQCEA